MSAFGELLALMQRLMCDGGCRAVYANLETAQTARGDADRGTAAICEAIAEAVGLFLDDPSLETWWQANGQGITPEQRIRRLLTAFIASWRRHCEPLLAAAPYHEIAPHLVLMAFLQRLVNGNGTLEREYAIGRADAWTCVCAMAR